MTLPNIATYKNIILVEPTRESGVQSLVVQLMTIEPDLFPFTVVDYDTHEGIDIIVKSNDSVPVHGSRLYYVEFKHRISTMFNHSFETYTALCVGIPTSNTEISKRH